VSTKLDTDFTTKVLVALDIKDTDDTDTTNELLAKQIANIKGQSSKLFAIKLYNEYIQDYGVTDLIAFIQLAVVMKALYNLQESKKCDPSSIILSDKFYQHLKTLDIVTKDAQGIDKDSVSVSEYVPLCILHPELAPLAVSNIKIENRIANLVAILYDIDIVARVCSRTKHSLIEFTAKPQNNIWSDSRMNMCRNKFFLYIKAEIADVTSGMSIFHTALSPYMSEWQALTMLGVVVPPVLSQQMAMMIHTSNSGSDIVRGVFSSFMNAK